MRTLTLGSLFDGAGTCPLAAVMCGITPIWASEIEPYPVKVTEARFPDMKHLGDITKINGREVEPVDIITFGSPCQDLSVAGKRAGLIDGERSSLFYDAVRIIREMRDATRGRYPRFIMWENVLGAFSSNNGNDFRAVLEEICAIGGYTLPVTRPPRGKWLNAGEIMGDGFSVAWRTLDARYWGVPQRRRRIYFVADFRSKCAAQILFERKGLSRHTESRDETGKEASPDALGGADRSGGVKCLTPWDQQSGRVYDANGQYPTLEAREHSGLNRQAVVYSIQGNIIDRQPQNGGNGAGIGENESGTLTAVDRHAIAFYARKGYGDYAEDDASTLKAWGGDQGGGSENLCVYPSTTGALMANSHPGGYTGQDAFNDMLVTLPGEHPRKFIVRRLTPLECCRLQGMPDWWTDGVEGSDSAEYKMWGNGMAFPCVLYVMQGFASIAEIEREAHHDL